MKFFVPDYKIILDIPTGNFLFNILTIHDTQYMGEYVLEIEKKIKDEKTLLIFFGAFENLNEYDHWVVPLNNLKLLRNNPMVVFNGRLSDDSSLTIKPLFNYYKINFYDHVSNVYCKEKIINEEFLSTAKRKYKFYWASSRDTYPRRYMLACLFENNLIDNNLINYKCLTNNVSREYLTRIMSREQADYIEKKCQEIKEIIPLPHLDETIEFTMTDKRFYNDSYVGIITETVFAESRDTTGIYISEKVFQAINYHQIFFYIGPPNSLKYIKDLGYYIFDDIFDLSYDSIIDNGERLIKAVGSLIKFLKKPIEEIQLIYNNKAVHIYHNKVLLQSQDKVKLVSKLLKKTINEN